MATLTQYIYLLLSVAVGVNTPIPTTTVQVEVGDVVGWYVAKLYNYFWTCKSCAKITLTFDRIIQSIELCPLHRQDFNILILTHCPYMYYKFVNIR